MGKLIYWTITSLDSYVANKDDNFDWAAPDEEVHTFVNDLPADDRHLPLRAPHVEVMRYWESAHALTDQPSFMQDFSRSYGGLPTRSCTPRRLRRHPAPGPGSSETSTLTPFDG